MKKALPLLVAWIFNASFLVTASAADGYTFQFANGSVLTLASTTDQVRFEGADGTRLSWKGRVDYFERLEPNQYGALYPSPVRRSSQPNLWVLSHDGLNPKNYFTSAFLIIDETAYCITQYGEALVLGKPQRQNPRDPDSRFLFWPSAQTADLQGIQHRVMGMMTVEHETLIAVVGPDGTLYQSQKKYRMGERYQRFSAQFSQTSLGIRKLSLYGGGTNDSTRLEILDLPDLDLGDQRFFKLAFPAGRPSKFPAALQIWRPLYTELNQLKTSAVDRPVGIQLESSNEVQRVHELLAHPELSPTDLGNATLVVYQSVQELNDSELDQWILEKNRIKKLAQDQGVFILTQNQGQSRLYFVNSDVGLQKALSNELPMLPRSVSTLSLNKTVRISPLQVENPTLAGWKHFLPLGSATQASNEFQINLTFRPDPDWARDLNAEVRVRSKLGSAAFMDRSHVVGVHAGASKDALFFEFNAQSGFITDALLEEAVQINELLKYRELYLVIEIGSKDQVAVRYFPRGAQISQVDYDLCNLGFTSRK